LFVGAFPRVLFNLLVVGGWGHPSLGAASGGGVGRSPFRELGLDPGQGYVKILQ